LPYSRPTIAVFAVRLRPLRPAVYIPNRNGRERLHRTLESLGPADGADVVVVDNGSSDGSVAMVRELHPDVRLIALSGNIGFGSALNRAIAEVPGDPILLVNNDVVCGPGFVAAMIAATESGAAMVAGVLLHRDDERQIDTAGIVAERDTLMAFDYLHAEDIAVLDRAAPPLGPSGGAALFARDAFLEAGGFDERIFLYYEDLDLSLRLRHAGHACALATEARGRHAFSATLGFRSGAKYARTGWSRAYLMNRYGVMDRPGPAARAVLAEAIVCAGQLVRDRTLQGARGRFAGWRASRHLPRLPVPLDALAEMPFKERLKLRSSRNRR